MSRKTSKRRLDRKAEIRPSSPGNAGGRSPQNNNQDVSSPADFISDEDRNIQIINPGIGDSNWNNNRLTNHTSNHSSDA